MYYAIHTVQYAVLISTYLICITNCYNILALRCLSSSSTI